MLTKCRKVFPWQEKQWQLIHTTHDVGRMPHAILLSGPIGIGLTHFCECLVASLLCESLDQNFYACGTCRACKFYHSKSHPDISIITPQEKNKQIKVDQIRQLIHFIHLKRQYRQYKVSVISPADAMNNNAANALLKTLEEPPQQSLLILLSHKPNLLPITIISRCQQIKFTPSFDSKTIVWVQQTFANQDAKQLLAVVGGVPLMIHHIAENNYINNILQDVVALSSEAGNVMQIAKKWQDHGTSQVLLWLSQLLPDLIRIKLSIVPKRISDHDIIQRLHVLVKRLTVYQLTLFYDTILESYSLSISLTSYNAQGLLENVILFWQSIFEKKLTSP